jgi:hypothetical protein
MKHSTLSALSLAAALVFPMVGCEKLESSAAAGDTKVDQALVKAETDKAQGGKAAEQTVADLKQAAGIGDASPAGQALAKSSLAREETERATSRMPGIAQRKQEIEVALWALQSAGAQIQATQATNATYAKLEPKEALAQVEQTRGEIKKAVDKAKADAGAAKAELDKRQKEIDELKSQRTAAENEAEQLSQKSADAKGKDAVELFRQSTEVRTKAGTLAAQIESKTAALMPFQRTVAIAEQQQQFWDSQNKDNPGAVQQLDERKTQIQSNWTATQGEVQAMNALAKKIADNELTPKSDKNHDNAAAMLVKLVKENNDQRVAAAADLEDAIKNYDAAAGAAKKARDAVMERVSAMQAKPSKPSELTTLNTLAGLYDENNYLLAKGQAQAALAGLQADEASELKMRANIGQQLARTLQASGLQISKELEPALATDQAATAAKNKADATYQEAEKTLNDVTEVTRNSEDFPSIKNAALVGLIGARYGHLLLTDDPKLKEPLKIDIARAKESQVEVPASVRNLK